MSQKPALALVILCAMVFIGSANAQTTHSRHAAEPTKFYPDYDPDSFTNLVPLPNNVLDTLRTTEQAKSMRKQLADLNQEEFAKLFRAVEIHLGSPRKLYYLVVGDFPMSAADSAWFWIVRPDHVHPEILLFSGGNGIEISSQSANGYPNIRGVWSSAAGYTLTRVYKFDGNKYCLWKAFRKTDKPA